MRPLCWAAALCALGCGQASVKRDATLTVKCPATEAMVFVDESFAGSAAESLARPLPLAAGFHRIELRADGKLTAYREVTLTHGGHATVEIALHPDLDQADR